MNKTIAQEKAKRKRKLTSRARRIQYRPQDINWAPQDKPMCTAGNIRYELADRTHGLGPGGVGAIDLLARRTGLVEAIDRRLHLLKVHLPYHESDHVLCQRRRVVRYIRRSRSDGQRVCTCGKWR